MSNDIQTPAIELCGVRIFASRSGTHVTGRADFPYESYGRTTISIDYHTDRSDGDEENTPASDFRLAARLALVQMYDELTASDSTSTKKEIAERVARASVGIKASWRSIQSWAAKFRDGGQEALRDNYVASPAKVLKLDPKTATDAVLIAAWWSFRIGAAAIDYRAMHTAGSAVTRFSPADCLAAIDSYYAWKTDRVRFPFKPFSRWVRYDLEKWVLRAADEEAYRTMLDHGKSSVPLHRAAAKPTAQPAQADRRREVAHAPTRRKIRDLSQSGDSIVHADQPQEPKTIMDSMRLLDDRYRKMLIDAAFGDRQLADQVVATFGLWWPVMPESVRNNITFQVNHHLDEQARQAANRGQAKPDRSRFFNKRCAAMLLTQIPKQLRTSGRVSDHAVPAKILRSAAS